MTKKIYKYLTLPLVFLFCIITLFACFTPKNKALADDTTTYYEFNGSNVTLPFANFLTTNNAFQKGVSNIALKFDYDTINSTYRVSFLNASLLYSKNNSLYYEYVGNIGFAVDDYSYPSYYVRLSDMRLLSSGELGIVESALSTIGMAPNDSRDNSLRAYFITNNRSFVPDIYKIQLGARRTGTGAMYNYVRYYDKNEYFVEFGVYAGLWDNGETGVAITLDTRIYFLADDDSNDYQVGYDDGYRDGLDDGEDETLNNYRDYWIEQGKDIGYREGLADASDYTFMSLMSSVIDAPLQVFTSMFEFDILGVNMKTFYLSLFTACIIIFILRKVL